MTIKRIADYLRENNIPYWGQDLNDKDNVEPFYISEMRGKKIAIETAGIICKQNYGAIQQALKSFPFQWIDDIGWTSPDPSEVYDIFKRYFKSYMKKIKDTGVIPIAIIEGKSPRLKSQTTAKRTEIKDNNKITAELNKKCMDLELFKKSVAAQYLPGATHVQLAMEVLQELEIITIRAFHEGEGVCAQLVINTEDPYHCDCAMTDDYDIFMYGCPSVIRNLRNEKTKGFFHGTGYALVDILTSLRFLEQSQVDDPIKFEEAFKRFQLLCILSGTDYHENVKGLGPAKIQKMILNHNIFTYEEICKMEERFYEIPYHQIIKTLEKNKRYNLVFDPSKSQEEIEIFNKERVTPSLNVIE